MRELIRNGVHWTVREAGASTSGTGPQRCLIFDSEAVVRRVWVYPEAWEALDDTQLWELMCGVPHVVAPLAPPHRIAWIDERRPAALEAEAMSCARSLLAEVTMLRQSNDTLLREHRELLDRCRRYRTEMRGAVETYAATMRASGVAPEQAIVRIKSAITAGVGSATAHDDPEAQRLMREAVQWGIAAYYAA